MNFTFRPNVERLDAREMPAVLVTGVFVAPPPNADDAPADIRLAPEAGAVEKGPKTAGYDLKQWPKV